MRKADVTRTREIGRQRPIFVGRWPIFVVRQYRPTKICRLTWNRPTSLESCCLIGWQRVP